MLKLKLTQNPFLLFSPFLVLFILLAFKQTTNVMEGDEGGYIYFAKNLLQGFYSPPAPDINLWWGPGYPILLIPFVALDLPKISITLLNTVFLYLSIVFLFKALLQFVSYRKALVFSLSWALCYSSYQYLSMVYTESFSVFLISLLTFSVVTAFNNQSKKYLYLSGFLLGYIALTKVIFGYVIMFLLLRSVVLWIINRESNHNKMSLIIMGTAFITVMPYLIYTYNLTGRLFYWGNSGGISLYWMSSPFENEYGNWNNETFTLKGIDRNKTGTPNEYLIINHQKIINEVLKYNGIQKDDAYKKIAINNIKTHPVKYIKNIITNISNSLFGFPISYTYQMPLIKIWYFAILYSLMLFSTILTVINWRKTPVSIRFILVYVFVYLAGSALVSGANRQFIIIVPIVLFWIAYIFHNTVKIKFNFHKPEQSLIDNK